MSTESKFLTFLEILRLKNCDLWESKLNHFQLLGKADLQLLYSHHLDTTLLKFHERTWVLDKDLQILGTRSIRGEWQAYSIVSPGGFYCLKVNNLNFLTQQHPEIVNFETIVENRSNFIRNTTLESRFDLFKEGHKSGLGGIGESIMNVVHSITDSLPHHDHTNHPNFKIVRPIEDLLSVDSTAVPVVDISEHDLNHYKTETIMLHDYQNLGEWKDLWTAGNEEYLHGFEKMRLHDTHGIRKEQEFQSQGQQFQSPQGFGQQQFQGQQQQQFQAQSQQFQEQFGRPLTENLGSQSQSQQGFDKLRSGELGYQEAPPGKHHLDQQEVLGGEQQRLPSYEVDQSKQQQGLQAAGSNIQEGVKPSPKTEETQFTTGLLGKDVEPPGEIGPSPKTPYHKNELENPPVELKPESGKQEKIGLLPQLESWGSNVTNASETTPTLDVDLKGEFRGADNRTNMDKINNSEISNLLKETGAP